jgi:putative nucleotidyltransferase with HDIG domain
MTPARPGLSPVARFSITLGAILAVTAVVLAAGTAYLIERYVEEETARFTQSSVASHFGTVFSEDVFDHPLSESDRESLESIVSFHFSIYGVVATQFFLPNGSIVFSYDEDEIGQRVSAGASGGLREALAGNAHSERTMIVADLRYAKPGAYPSAEPSTGTHVHGSVDPTSQLATIDALESWVPVEREGRVIGAAVVWRDMTPVQSALQAIQLATALIIALAAAVLWLLLRGVYARSSQQIVRQAAALSAAVVEIETTYDRTLQALSNALDVRDSETEGHARRVVAYMELIARELGVDDDELAVLRRGALLHDIGKVGVPDRILRKPAALSEAEWTTMKKHPDLGARIIGGIPFLEHVAAIVRHHHERWDGGGYPDGIAAEAIPLGARIFTVADSFDAMTSDRPYRSAMSVEEARREVDRCRGTQFDPRVVDAFLGIPVARLREIEGAAPHGDRLAVAAG